MLWPCNDGTGFGARHPMLGVGVGVERASTKHSDARRMSGVRRVRSGWIPARAATS
ncbi:hypothetical protein L3055_10835 [Corynebacterium sp. MC-02]|nr:hypothetical protein [Corynebacterium parakroppenstedtii]MCF8704031.1 hypothetical protein [Corynebacterium pseudokroppenstedtii]